MIEIVRRTNLATLLPATIATGHDDLVAIALDPAVLRRTAVLLQRKGRTEARPRARSSNWRWRGRRGNGKK